MKRKTSVPKKKMRISVKRRLNLIDLVLRQGYSIVRASKKLELKPYTAASILNKYKQKGVVFDQQLKKYITPDPNHWSQKQCQQSNNNEPQNHSEVAMEEPQLEQKENQEEGQAQVPNFIPYMGFMPYQPQMQPYLFFYYP